MRETQIPASELRAGDRIDNWCDILRDVAVESVGQRVTLRRADGSRFDVSFPSDALVLVREPRPAERAVA